MIRLLSDFLDGLANVEPWIIYTVVAGMVFAETAAFVGLIFPGELTLVVASVLAAQGTVNPFLLGVVAFAAAALGDLTAYRLGRRLGPRLDRSRLGRHDRLLRAQRLLAERGVVAVVIGRWVSVLRAVVPPLAGVAQMPWRRFVVADLIAVSTWVAACIGAGYLARGSWKRAESMVQTTGGVALLVLLALIAGAAGWTWWRRRHQAGVGDRA